MRLRLTGDYYHGHREGCGPWETGEVREVPAETAAYLLGTFPGRFADETPKPVKAEAVATPPLDRAIRSPDVSRSGNRGGR